MIFFIFLFNFQEFLQINFKCAALHWMCLVIKLQIKKICFKYVGGTIL